MSALAIDHTLLDNNGPIVIENTLMENEDLKK